MALQMNVESVIGLTLPNAYIKIDFVSGNAASLSLTVSTYVSKTVSDQAKNGEKRWVEQRYIIFIPSVEDGSPNFIKQGYEYLKTLPEYAGATDVLEE